MFKTSRRTSTASGSPRSPTASILPLSDRGRVSHAGPNLAGALDFHLKAQGTPRDRSAAAGRFLLVFALVLCEMRNQHVGHRRQSMVIHTLPSKLGGPFMPCTLQQLRDKQQRSQTAAVVVLATHWFYCQ